MLNATNATRSSPRAQTPATPNLGNVKQSSQTRVYTEIFKNIPCSMLVLSWIFHENPSTRLSVMILTDKQTHEMEIGDCALAKFTNVFVWGFWNQTKQTRMKHYNLHPSAAVMRMRVRQIMQMLHNTERHFLDIVVCFQDLYLLMYQ